MPPDHHVREVDAFDLPDWLGEAPTTWTAASTVRCAAHVTGTLQHEADSLPCDLLACDVAYPEQVVPGEWRRAAHQLWAHGQVLLVEYDARLTLAVPGSEFSADLVLESLARLAKAVGVAPGRFVAALRL